MSKPLPFQNLPSYKNVTKTLSLREKAGQLFMPAAFINDTEREIQNLERLIREQGVGGICFFHSRASAATNFEGTKKVLRNEKSFETLKSLIQRYQEAAKYPLLIAIDAEWGLAMRIENTPQYPYAITLGAIADNRTDLIYEVGKNIAQDCRSVGIHWNLAPCVDINNNPNNPVIGYRSFGMNKFKVTEKALAFIKGTQSEGILTSIKHFPGHGDTATDSHLELPLIDKTKEELLENELHPFQALIDEGVDSVMVGHLSVPALADGKTISSSVSKEIIKHVLCDEMGYTGVVISDALNMHAVTKNYPVNGELEWLAFDAGNDMLCFADHVAEGIETIVKKASREQVEESFERIWRLKEKASDSHVEPIDPSQGSSSTLKDSADLNRELARESLTLIQGAEEDISDFRASGFVGICFSQNIDNPFFKSIQKNHPFKSMATRDNFVQQDKNVLVAIFPPQVKPADKFRFPEEELIFINELIQIKNVVLYLFGNPYVLNHIAFEKARAVVIAYQNFKPFQDMAAAHFLGNFRTKGKLPVEIETNQ
jgi:beta-glucosidase-like glycosyl hydrolase